MYGYIFEIRLAGIYPGPMKIIMDLEKCSYEMATGIGLAINAPTKTPYGIEWDSLVEEKKHRRELARAQRRTNRKQATPRRLLRSREKMPN